jgi:hypothetical protein
MRRLSKKAINLALGVRTIVDIGGSQSAEGPHADAMATSETSVSTYPSPTIRRRASRLLASR